MLILHGSFLPEKNSQASRFVIWGESLGGVQPTDVRKREHGTSTSPLAERESHSALGSPHSALRTPQSAHRTRPHPFAATQELLQELLVGAIREWWIEGNPAEVSVVAHLPTVKNKPVPSQQSMMSVEARDSQWVLK